MENKKPTLKEVLLEMVANLEDLRANQDLLARRVGLGVTIADAQDAKRAAIEAHKTDFDGLRKKIEGLA